MIPKRIFFLLLVLSVPVAVLSQEFLTPLSSNLNYFYKDLGKEQQLPSKHVPALKPASSMLELPFKEDFYYCTQTDYPVQDKWSDSLVYINNGYGKAPPSIGVATFDGLNKNGYPYTPNLTNIASSLPADTLTSRPINLYTKGSQTLDATSSHVGLSFFYQARGNGDNPEVTDSLLLDFYKPLQNTWSNVWFSRGNSTSNSNDSTFKYAFVKVSDSAYFHQGFKFRFRNWASTAGNFDNWNIDYIFLDKDRNDTLKDTVNYDVTFGGLPTPFLSRYSAMPIEQYHSGEMAPKLSVRLRNNYLQPISIGYKYKISDPSGTANYTEYDGGFDNITPFDTNGYSNYTPHSNPSTSVSGAFVMPASDSVDFTIKHYLFPGSTGTVGTGDFFPENDTLIQYQRFRNYYAFDDGSCEAGYYVLGVKAKMAVKVLVNNPDSIRGLRIYFDPAGYIKTVSSSYQFRLFIWKDQSGMPGTVFYRDSAYYKPIFKDTLHAPFYEYALDSGRARAIEPGIYYVGFEQYNATGTITVGFDRNYDHSSSMFYNTGTNWYQSTLKGSIMMRPVFGKKVPKPVGLTEQSSGASSPYQIFPNPSSGNFTIQNSEPGEKRYRLLSLSGQLLDQGSIRGSEEQVNAEHLGAGIYLLELENTQGVRHQQKLIISR